jgi:predicted metal-dependent phosphoesterase TrpH
MQQGYADSMQDAFNNYLVPCNIPKEYIPFDDAIKEIKRLGGVAVLTHPQSISRVREELLRILTDMASRGLDGVEALNTMGIEGEEQYLCRVAKALDLSISGGSDFHGGEEGLKMGRGRGNLAVPFNLLAPLEEKRKM